MENWFHMSVNSLAPSTFTAQPSPIVVVGMFLRSTSKWTVPYSIPFKDTILKIGGYSGKIRLAPSWLIIWIVSTSIDLRFGYFSTSNSISFFMFTTLSKSWFYQNQLLKQHFVIQHAFGYIYFCVGFSDMKPWNSDIAPLIVTVALFFTGLMLEISFTSSSHRASPVKDPGTCFIEKGTLEIPPSLATAHKNTVFISFAKEVVASWSNPKS